MMKEDQLLQFKEYLEFYIECADEDTDLYRAANIVLDNVEEGLQFVAQHKAQVSTVIEPA